MANWQQELLQAEDREKQQRQGLDKPFGVNVVSVSSDSEVMKIRYYGNNDRDVLLSHPFTSAGSWIRAIPETGTAMIAQFRADESPPQVLSYAQRNTLGRIDSYKKGLGVYRPLYPGEMDISSSGVAQFHFARRPRYTSRAGTIERWADQDRLTSGDRAPIHTMQFLKHESGVLGEEYRAGVVTRPKNTWEVTYPKVRGAFAAEEFIEMKNPADETPEVLFRAHRGHVLDENGEQILQQKTQIPLRYRANYYANGDTSTDFEIDEKGNYFLRLADEATEGYELEVPKGNYRKTVDKDEEIQITANRVDAVGKSVNMTVGENYTKTVKKNIKFVSENGGSSMIFDSTSGAEKVVFATKSGHLFVLDDTSGKESIYIIHKSGSQIVTDKNGSHKLVTNDGSFIFMDTEEGAVTITSKSGAFLTVKETVTFSDKSGSNTVSFGGDTIQFAAKSDVILSAQKVTLDGGSVNLGSQATLSAVIGEMLESALDAHIHPTAVGPSGPAVIPFSTLNANPATSFKSSAVKIKSNLG